MSLKDKKKEVNAKINALNKVTEKGKDKLNGYKDKLKSKKEAINNKKNETMAFIVKILGTIASMEELIKETVKIVTDKLPLVEQVIKNELIKQLKEVASCSINPSIPIWLLNEGMDLRIKDIDFFDMFKSDPLSVGGSLVYDDEKNGLNSTDFNTFLYQVIFENKDVNTVNGGKYFPWGKSTVGKDFIEVRFSPTATFNGVNTLNVLNFKVLGLMKNISLMTLNQMFVNSIKIFGEIGSDKILNKLMDDLWGTIKKQIQIPTIKIVEQEKFSSIMECICYAENDIDDSFFNFSNEELYKLETEAKNKKKGIRVFDCCKQNVTSLDAQVLIDAQKNIKDSYDNPPVGFTKDTAKVKAVTTAIDKISENATVGIIDPIDIKNIQFNFIKDMLRNLPLSVINFMVSPKLMVLFALNHQILYGKGSTYKDVTDFVKKNSNTFKSISKTIYNTFIKFLLNLIIQRLSDKISKKIIDDAIEKNRSYTTQLRLLTGLNVLTSLITSKIKI